MKAEQELEKDALAAEETPTVYADINTLPTEAEQPCRTQSALQFIAPNGIFTSLTKTRLAVIIRGVTVEVIRFRLTLNPAHRIKPNMPPQNCSSDGVTFLAAQSVNVRSVAEPQFIRNSSNVITGVNLFFQRINKNQPATLGVRVKFEENVSSPTQFNPKRKAEKISFP